MNDRLKRILIIAAFSIGVLIIAYLLYFVFFRSEPQVVQVGPETTEQQLDTVLPDSSDIDAPDSFEEQEEADTGLPGVDDVASGGLTATDILTPDIDAANPTVSNDGLLQYYNPEDGRFYIVDNNGKIVQASDAQFSNVENVTWANDGDNVILEFPDGSNVSYNLQTGEQVTLPPAYTDFSFSPTSDQIVFKHLADDVEQNVLAVSNADGTSARTLEPLGNEEDTVDVDYSPTGRVVATYSEFIDASRQEIGFIGLNDENFKGVVVDGYGLETDYSPDGQRLLYSTFSEDNEYKPTLGIVDANGEDIGKNRNDLKLNTFAHKCSFAPDASKVYCGVPKEQKYGYGLEPGILEGVTDDIYEVDLNSGVQKRLAIPVDQNGTPSYSVEQMFTSADGSYLYFRDSSTGQLIKIDI